MFEIIDEFLDNLYKCLCKLCNKITGKADKSAIEEVMALVSNFKETISSTPQISLKEWNFDKYEIIEVTDEVSKLICEKINIPREKIQLPREIIIRDYTADLVRLYPDDNDYRRKRITIITDNGGKTYFTGSWGDYTLYEDLKDEEDSAKEMLEIIKHLTYMFVEYECDYSGSDHYGNNWVLYKVTPEAKNELVKIFEEYVAEEEKELAEQERQKQIAEEHKQKVLKKLKGI